MEKLDIDDVQRLILANQYEILSRLSEDGEKESHADLAQQLREGHAWLYQHAFQWLSPVLPDDQARFVVDVLSMYRSLSASYKDGQGIEKSDVRFPGFDGNNEGELMSFATALGKAGRFKESLGEYGCPNSHSPSIDIYQRMLKVYRATEGGKLAAEEVKAIVAARAYPGGV